MKKDDLPIRKDFLPIVSVIGIDLAQTHEAIGLLLCNCGDKVVAQYSLFGYEQTIGVIDYQLSRVIPEHLHATPSNVKKVEEELSKFVDK